MGHLCHGLSVCWHKKNGNLEWDNGLIRPSNTKKAHITSTSWKRGSQTYQTKIMKNTRPAVNVTTPCYLGYGYKVAMSTWHTIADSSKITKLQLYLPQVGTNRLDMMELHGWRFSEIIKYLFEKLPPPTATSTEKWTWKFNTKWVDEGQISTTRLQSSCFEHQPFAVCWHRPKTQKVSFMVIIWPLLPCLIPKLILVVTSWLWVLTKQV